MRADFDDIIKTVITLINKPQKNHKLCIKMQFLSSFPT